MKIPYVKIYTADLLATSRKLTPEQIGQAILGLCEQAFENETAYQPQSQAEQALFDMLVSWKQESIAALKQKKNAGRSGAKKRWQKEREKQNFQTVASLLFLLMADRNRYRNRVIKLLTASLRPQG